MSTKALINEKRYIVMGTTRKKLEGLIQKNQAQVKITDELPIINGFVLEGSSSLLKKFSKNMPKGVISAPERHLRIAPEIHGLEIPGPKISSPKTPVSKITFSPALDRSMDVLGMQKVWNMGFTGKGVGIAITDTGVYPHNDFDERIVTFKDFMGNRDEDPHDYYGHGTPVTGCAAGSGKVSGGRYKAPAFQANIIGLKIANMDENGNLIAPDSATIKAIQWAVENKNRYNIKVMNISLGNYPSNTPWQADPVSRAVDQAIKAGIVLTVAAGNLGPNPRTISPPANVPSAVTVGSLDDKRTTSRNDDEVRQSSSRGPTYEGDGKPDILAPGVKIVCPAPYSKTEYRVESGTSFAAPIAAGVIATWFQANPSLTPTQVKKILVATSKPISGKGYTENDQGKGVIDPYDGLLMALKLKSKSYKTVYNKNIYKKKAA